MTPNELVPGSVPVKLLSRSNILLAIQVIFLLVLAHTAAVMTDALRFYIHIAARLRLDTLYRGRFGFLNESYLSKRIDSSMA